MRKKLIDKDTLAREIERRIKYDEMVMDHNTQITELLSRELNTLYELSSFIKSLEVKEVDLEKEIEEVKHNYKVDDNRHTSICSADIEWLANHFFELGFKSRIDKELVEEVYSHLDSIKDTADRMTSGNFMHNRAAIKFSANTIAKVLELMSLKTQKGE